MRKQKKYAGLFFRYVFEQNLENLLAITAFGYYICWSIVIQLWICRLKPLSSMVRIQLLR